MSKTLTEIYWELVQNPVLKGGGDKGTGHSYIEVYEELFKDLKEPVKLLEIGVNYAESMKLWYEYFHKDSELYGCDIVHNNLIFNDFKFILEDASSPNLANKFEDEYFDIIIDDGSHHIVHQVMSAANLLPKLKKGGLYIIEDIQSLDNPQHRAALQNIHPNAEILDRRAIKGQYDDVMVVVKK